MDNFIHRLSTVRKLSYKLIHRISTAYPQDIHSLSTGTHTGYLQVIHSAHLSVIKLSRLSTGYPQRPFVSDKTQSENSPGYTTYPQVIHSGAPTYPQDIHRLIHREIRLIHRLSTKLSTAKKVIHRISTF